MDLINKKANFDYEIVEKYDWIVEFSGLERFVDAKLKNLSSGMQVRLGFSITVSVDTPILLVDEVLADLKRAERIKIELPDAYEPGMFQEYDPYESPYQIEPRVFTKSRDPSQGSRSRFETGPYMGLIAI